MVDCENITSLRGGTVSKPCSKDNGLGLSAPGGCTPKTAQAWRKLARELVTAVPDDHAKKADLVGRLAKLNYEYDLRETGFGGDKQLLANPWKLNVAAKRYAMLARDACKVVPPARLPPEVAEKVPLLEGMPAAPAVTAGIGLAAGLALAVGAFFLLREFK